ncbi:hypothetical protein E4U41_000812 [Claviceps citrina]|nr:hypothetical protein E4U41_000812 [Claviceps citrina]
MVLLSLSSWLLVTTWTSRSAANVFPPDEASRLLDQQRQPQLQPQLQQSLEEHIALADPSTTPDTPFSLQTFLSSSSSNASHGPSHGFHVYTSPDFAGGRGISIITTEERIKPFRRVTLAPGVNSRPSSSPPPFEKRDIPGKGRGLVATSMIRRGDRVFAHTPLILVDAEMFLEAELDWIALEEEAVNGLPARSQGLFWELYGRPVQHPVAGRVDANSFNLVVDDSETTFYGVFPETSRLNHDCRPNLAYYFDNNTLTHYVHAITDIPPGAEISITYIDSSRPREARMAQLRSTWGFNCSCSQCSLPPELARVSDRRLDQIHDLMVRVSSGIVASPAAADRLVSLFHQERLHAPVAEAYSIAALSACFEGRYTETLHWATLALEATLLDSGPQSPNVGDLAQMADRPDEHDCWLGSFKKKVPDLGDVYGGQGAGDLADGPLV